tara:strand:- start:68 stop:391 length:324 start_codon:yes stop_codon:yes gene_type:complete
MNDKILLLNNGFNNIEFIEFVALNMAQLYAASKPLESFLIKRMQNLLYKVSVCDNESKKIFIWDLLDEIIIYNTFTTTNERDEKDAKRYNNMVINDFIKKCKKYICE